MTQTLAELGVSARVANGLEDIEVFTLANLVSHTRAELLRPSSVGQTALQELKQLLIRLNVPIPPDWGEAVLPPPKKTGRRSAFGEF